MDQVDGFEWANHDIEFGNPAIRAPGSHVQATNIKSFLKNNARNKLVRNKVKD